jgi:spore coat polysaccharide biosynthesis protein SpsF
LDSTLNVIAILQARMSSSRLPGKVLKPILGHPMLALQLERIRRSASLDKLVVATSTMPEDDGISRLCAERGIDVFRGSLEDVLDRCYQAAVAYGADHVVRLTGDCPLADPDVIDRVVGRHLKAGLDYTANVFPPTWPDGLDVEVVRFQCLEEAWREARLPSEREHVTYFLETRPTRFRFGNVAQDDDLSPLRWTVDNPEDFEFIRRIYTALYPTNSAFSTADVLALLEKEPQLSQINANIARDEGFQAALEADRLYLENLGTDSD